VLVVGEKERPEPALRTPASFHLVERDFGRFARAIRIHAAIDAANARATLKDGELRVVVTKLQERRGREILIPVERQESKGTGEIKGIKGIQGINETTNPKPS
jgi:HSP20 family molecular chaperone IbpA